MADRLPVSVTVLLPTRNEEEAIGATIDAIPRDWCDKLEIMIVDGSSTDRTREIALEKGARVHLEPRKGYGRAYRTGFEVAKGDIIVTMDPSRGSHFVLIQGVELEGPLRGTQIIIIQNSPLSIVREIFL